MTDIKQATAKLLKNEFNISEEVTALMFKKGILHTPDCRDALICDEYKKKVESKEKQRIKGKIAAKYCVSVALIEKKIAKSL